MFLKEKGGERERVVLLKCLCATHNINYFDLTFCMSKDIIISRAKYKHKPSIPSDEMDCVYLGDTAS